MHPISFLRGVGLGAGLMYFLDPHRGRYRRALVRDQLIHLNRKASSFLDSACRDLQHRAEGAICEVRHAMNGEVVPDEILVQRIRAQMGRCLTHPRNIEVSAHHGRVTLRGPILAREAQDLFHCVRGIHVVKSVVNELDLHEEAGNISELQGEGHVGCRGGLLTGSWSPGTRLLVGSLGSLMLFRGLFQQAPAACVNGTIGLGLLARAFTSAPTARTQHGRWGQPQNHTSQQRRTDEDRRIDQPSAMRTSSDDLVAGALSDSVLE